MMPPIKVLKALVLKYDALNERLGKKQKGKISSKVNICTNFVSIAKKEMSYIFFLFLLILSLFFDYFLQYCFSFLHEKINSTVK